MFADKKNFLHKIKEQLSTSIIRKRSNEERVAAEHKKRKNL